MCAGRNVALAWRWLSTTPATAPTLQFYEAAKVEGHAQAAALAGLGRYFQEVEHKPEQAMRCYKRALALDPTVAVAGSPRAAAQPPKVVADWVNNVADEAAEEAAVLDSVRFAPVSPEVSAADATARMTTE